MNPSVELRQDSVVGLLYVGILNNILFLTNIYSYKLSNYYNKSDKHINYQFIPALPFTKLQN